MKKLFVCLLSLVMVLSAAACADQSNAPSAQTPAPTAAPTPTPEPTPTPTASLTTYTGAKACFTIDMPPGYETEEGEYGVIFRNELNDRFLSIGYSVFLDADKTNPFYSASDAEKARDEFLDAAFGADGYELLSAEYARVDGAEAYLIRCAVNEDGEADTDGIVAAVPAQGGFGYYIICGVWARSDAAGRAEIDAAIASLRRTGTVDTRFALLSSEELGFRMLYEKALTERFAIQEASDNSVMSAFFFPVTQNPGSLLEVERASYAENAVDAMAGYQEGVYGRIDPDAQATELLDVTVGKTVYLVREYAVHFNGEELWLTYCAVDMEGACYALICVSNEANRETMLSILSTAMQTLKPL